MTVGELVAGIGEVGADGAEDLVGEVAEPPGYVRVGRLAEPVVEVGGGREDFLDRGEDTVVGSGQLGEGGGRLVCGGGRSNTAGEVGDGGAGRRVARRPVVGVEVRVAGHVVALGPEAGDSGGG
ncbi:hypothetical protein [Streptomyces californicus]|uniref:hypothetical protein n=1 Tax=Streptomyces californicus TaxID=67351 RepID=UPI0037909DFB